MDSLVSIYLDRALNELTIAELLFKFSDNKEDKLNYQIEEEMTFYSAVITHSYYSCFYAAKALLLTKNIKTSAPEVHKKTYDAFKETFVDSQILNLELLKIYKKMIIKADTLLKILKTEKSKRGKFTYRTIPSANKEPASESINNATTFLKHIKSIIEK